MTAISFYKDSVYSAMVFEGDKKVDVVTASSLSELKAKVKRTYGIKVL